MHPEFHLSIAVRSLQESVEFFQDILKSRVTHRDANYVNIDFYGTQITLKENKSANPDIPDFHFGVNLSLSRFDELAAAVLASGYSGVVMKPKVVDVGTPMERKKMYLKCPTGYLIELKGYR